jgi:hypothetical protein
MEKLRHDALASKLKLPLEIPKVSQEQDPTAPSAQAPPVHSIAETDQRINSLLAQWSTSTGRFEREMRTLLEEIKQNAVQSFKGLVFW